MRDVDQPPKIDVAWGSSAAAPYIRTVPIPAQPQSGGTAGFASWTTGFPPLNFQPVVNGGIPPFGADANGALNQISAGLQWLNVIGINFWDGTLSSYIGGYASGSVVQSPQTFGLFYQSTVDNNATNPDEGGANWTAFSIYGRIRLSNNLTLYVSTTGSDINPGTQAAPFATIQRAINVLYALYDLNGFTVTISVAAGIYSSSGPAVTISGAFLGQGQDPVHIIATGGQVTINAVGYAFNVTNAALIRIASNNFFLNVVADAGGNGYGISAILGAGVVVTGIINFSYCAAAHVAAFEGGFVFIQSGQEIISGPSKIHYQAGDLGIIQAKNITWVLNDFPFFETAFAYVDDNGVLVATGCSQSGSASGPQFQLLSGGQIITNGSTISTYFPGTTSSGVGFHSYPDMVPYMTGGGYT